MWLDPLPVVAGVQVGKFNTPLSDGWGITTDDQYLVVSDGSDKITWIDPANGYKQVKQISVVDGNKRIEYLNEVGTALSTAAGGW